MRQAELLHCSSCRKKNLSPEMFKFMRNGKRCKTCRICSFRKLQYSKTGKRIFDHYMQLINETSFT